MQVKIIGVDYKDISKASEHFSYEYDHRFESEYGIPFFAEHDTHARYSYIFLIKKKS